MWSRCKASASVVLVTPQANWEWSVSIFKSPVDDRFSLTHVPNLHNLKASILNRNSPIEREHGLFHRLFAWVNSSQCNAYIKNEVLPNFTRTDPMGFCVRPDAITVNEKIKYIYI